MKKIKVNTGFGYIKDAEDRIVAKCELSKGEHPINEEFVYVEVANKEELDALNIHLIREAQTPEQLLEAKIQAELRQIAINSLTAKGGI